MDARLEMRLKDISPKCATCGAWVERPKDDELGRPEKMCTIHQIKTLDLAVCSDWYEAPEDKESD